MGDRSVRRTRAQTVGTLLERVWTGTGLVRGVQRLPIPGTPQKEVGEFCFVATSPAAEEVLVASFLGVLRIGTVDADDKSLEVGDVAQDISVVLALVDGQPRRRYRHILQLVVGGEEAYEGAVHRAVARANPVSHTATLVPKEAPEERAPAETSEHTTHPRGGFYTRLGSAGQTSVALRPVVPAEQNQRVYMVRGVFGRGGDEDTWWRYPRRAGTHNYSGVYSSAGNLTPPTPAQ